jgi:simple sugar transport system permease protein
MNSRLPVRFLLVIVPIVISLLITSLLILLVGQNPAEVAQKIWEGAFRNSESTAGVFNFWIPLVLASMGLIITFTAGLWNIGVEGQMMAGAIAASFVARSFDLPPAVAIPAEIIAAILAGGGWGLLVGILRTQFGVHEIFGGVGLNAIISVYAIYLISGPWTPPEGGSAQATAPFPPNALLEPMSSEFPVSLLAIVLAVLAIIIVHLLLRRTRWGLQLKATGHNARSALLLGVPTTRVTLSAFIACGMLAGIGGAYRVLFTYDSLRPNVSGGIGFLGLLVVLLTGMSTIWTPMIAFVFSAILAGSGRLRISLGLDSSLAGVLQGTLVLVMLLFQGVRQRWAGTGPQSTESPPEAASPEPGSASKVVAHE